MPMLGIFTVTTSCSDSLSGAGFGTTNDSNSIKETSFPLNPKLWPLTYVDKRQQLKSGSSVEMKMPAHLC